ncbi:glycosyltransferase family 2 protein [Vagococcus fluvialis]|uniref:glycosyltransferase family 2 protein n=1 Tax=Vagococcus fluvialis TaxID=2738 RepID=UPI001D0BC487|nr:glycosyltransferase family 2 protein [Vagococcus fluvialis]UDM73874.1 glycosyltransferase family 2 protein [Vagococcus fluvialis]
MSLTTVIIPVFNGEEYIRKTLSSVFNQTKRCEIIVINDGSKDNTEMICLTYNDRENFTYIKTENRGVSSARNLGISLSKTKYVSFLDSDDTYELTFVEKMENEISKLDSDVCFCGNNNIISDRKSQKKILYKNTNIFTNYLKNKTTPHTNSWLLKKDFLIRNNLSFKIGNSFGEDMIFFSSLLLAQPIVCSVPEELTNYNLDTPDSLSKKNIKIESDINWCKEVTIAINNSNFPNKKKEEFITILENYRLSVGIVSSILNSNMSIEEKRNLTKKYKNYINIFNLSNGLRSIKGMIIYSRLLWKLR